MGCAPLVHLPSAGACPLLLLDVATCRWLSRLRAGEANPFFQIAVLSTLHPRSRTGQAQPPCRAPSSTTRGTVPLPHTTIRYDTVHHRISSPDQNRYVPTLLPPSIVYSCILLDGGGSRDTPTLLGKRPRGDEDAGVCVSRCFGRRRGGGSWVWEGTGGCSTCVRAVWCALCSYVTERCSSSVCD